MAADVVTVAPIVVDEVLNLMPLAALPPLSPSSVCSSSASSSLSASVPSSPVDSSDALSTASSASHEIDCAMVDCSSSNGIVDKKPHEQPQQLAPDTTMSLDEQDPAIMPLLPHLDAVSNLHPLARASFSPHLAFSRFVQFVNKPESNLHSTDDEQPSEVLSQLIKSAAAAFAFHSPSPSSSATLPCIDQPATATTASSVTFTLEATAIATLPVVMSSTIHDDYEQLQQQQKRRLRAKAKPQPTLPQPTSAKAAASSATAESMSSPVSLKAGTTHLSPDKKPRSRPRRSAAASSATSLAGSSGGRKRRKRTQLPAAKPNLILKFKRVPQAKQQSPLPALTASHLDMATSHIPSDLTPSQLDANGAATGMQEKLVVEDREQKKLRVLWEHIEARDREEKRQLQRMQPIEWQVSQHEEPVTQPAAKAVDSDEDILGAAERHDERLARIEAAPLLTPTAAEFRNPMRYIRHIVNKHRQYGVVCIRPPEGWQPAYEYTLDKEGLSFPCKRQVVKRYSAPEKYEKAQQEERKEAEEATATKPGTSHLDAIALQVSAFPHNEQLTMAEFRRDELQRRVEWEQMKTKWQHKANRRQLEQQPQPPPSTPSPVLTPSAAVMAQLVTDIASPTVAAADSPPLREADSADMSCDAFALPLFDCSSTEDQPQCSDSTDDGETSLPTPFTTCAAPEAAPFTAPPDVTSDNTASITARIVNATPVVATPSLLPRSTATTHSQVESDYWRWAMLYGKNKPTVYYANDVDTHPEQRTPLPPLPPTSSLLDCPPSRYHPWDLSALNSLPSSFLHHLDRSIPGITAPMLYIGMLHSTFCWHHEDHHLYSISYNHAGSLPKTWYGVPGSHCRAVEELANHHLYPFFDSTRSHLLARKTSMFTPVLLHESGIPVYRAVQEEGMFVITFPRAYHSGFSHGFSLAESVNFALDDWLPDGGEATRMYRQLSQFPVVPFTELVVRAVETAVRESGSVEYEDDIRVDGLARLERTFAEVVLDELNEREQLYGSGRHLHLSFAHLRCQLATRYCKSCLHATYLSHVRCDCRVGGGVCLSGHGLCRVHREESEVVLAFSSLELITLLNDLQRTMLDVKKAMREKRAANGTADAAVDSEVLTDEEKVEVNMRNERFDRCVALATSLNDRESGARDLHVLLADERDEEEHRPRRRMTGGGAGGGAGRRRKKQLLSESETNEPSTDVAVPVNAASAMEVDEEPSATPDQTKAPAAVDGHSVSVCDSIAQSGHTAAKAMEAALFISHQLLQEATRSSIPPSTPEWVELDSPAVMAHADIVCQ